MRSQGAPADSRRLGAALHLSPLTCLPPEVAVKPGGVFPPLWSPWGSERAGTAGVPCARLADPDFCPVLLMSLMVSDRRV